jgi:Domain of unknown function (DUF1937)
MKYLATPYSHPDAAIRIQRYELACAIAGELMLLNHQVFSPIAHCHPISRFSPMGTDWTYWQGFCLEMIRRTDELWIATMSGWKDSKGIGEETAIAIALGKPIYLINPDTFDRTIYFEGAMV